LSALPREFDYKMDKYGGYEGSGGRFSGNPSSGNRMTSINININTLEEKKEPRVNVRLSKNRLDHKYGEDFAEEERNYRAEKKRKIREKAAALLNRVKSQEYMRTADVGDYQYQHPDAYFQQRYY
jgi:hypothetical protein